MKLCAECGNKSALFKIKGHGKVKADKRHNLCFRCARSYFNRDRQQHISGLNTAETQHGNYCP